MQISYKAQERQLGTHNIINPHQSKPTTHKLQPPTKRVALKRVAHHFNLTPRLVTHQRHNCAINNPDASSTTPETQQFCQEQLDFLERKRLVALGLAPAMPASSMCPVCDGVGMAPCHECDGTGINQTDPTLKFNDDVRVNAPIQNAQVWFILGGPCYLCKGSRALGCRDCAGTGFKSGMQHCIGD